MASVIISKTSKILTFKFSFMFISNIISMSRSSKTPNQATCKATPPQEKDKKICNIVWRILFCIKCINRHFELYIIAHTPHFGKECFFSLVVSCVHSGNKLLTSRKFCHSLPTCPLSNFGSHLNLK